MPPPTEMRSGEKSSSENPAVFIRPVEQGVHPGDHGEPHPLQRLDEPRHVARVGDQHAQPSEPHVQQAVHREREDVIERQRGDDHILTFAGEGAQEAVRLQDAGDHVAMGEHRALRDPGGAPRCTGGTRDHRPFSSALPVAAPRPEASASFQRTAPSMRNGGDELLDVAHHEVHERGLGKAEHVAESGHDHVLHVGVVDALLEHVPEVLEHHDRPCTGIDELVTQLAGGVQRVGVDDDEPRAQRTDERNGVLQDVRHHQRDAIPLRKPRTGGQVPREVLRKPVELGEGDAHAHVLEGRAVRKTRNRFVDDRGDRRVRIGVDFVRRTLGVAGEPNAFRHRLSPFSFDIGPTGCPSALDRRATLPGTLNCAAAFPS